jgi:hypothetical protein
VQTVLFTVIPGCSQPGIFLGQNFPTGQFISFTFVIFLISANPKCNPLMKKPLLTLVGVAGGVLLLGAIAKGAIARNLNFVVSGLRVGGTVLQPVLYVILGVQNPSSLDYTIQSFSGNVFVNGMLIGVASKFQETVLKANSQTPYEISVQVSILVLGSEVLQLFQGVIQGNLRIQGTVNVEHVPFPVDITYKII